MKNTSHVENDHVQLITEVLIENNNNNYNDELQVNVM
jgi:hypothetical protein